MYCILSVQNCVCQWGKKNMSLKMAICFRGSHMQIIIGKEES